jgi:hypothetical protein
LRIALIVAATSLDFAYSFYTQEKAALANQIPEEALAAMEHAVGRHPGGASAAEIMRALAAAIPQRTLQYRLKHLVTRKRLVMEGKGLGKIPDARVRCRRSSACWVP